ncbi:MAG: dipicolinate synthase subunit DpsA [Oscillospiraceae bacterium]|nr:dipicolinate synthase subunit DpsA [Oscillospiraceae bacterium]
MVKLKFAVIGGDRRAAYAVGDLAARKLDVRAAALELSGLVDPQRLVTVDRALAEADAILLPVPLLGADGRLFCEYACDRPEPREIVSKSKSGALLFAGRVPEELFKYARLCGRELIDIFSREELKIRNAVPTAEGALEILLRRLPGTIAGSELAVTGYGRSAQAMCTALQALGASVTVCARDPAALALARTRGCDTLALSEISLRKRRFDSVINTVSARVIGESELKKLPRGCLILDLASESCLEDERAPAAFGIEYERALSLPGKSAPKTAGRIIVETVLDILREGGVAI